MAAVVGQDVAAHHDVIAARAKSGGRSLADHLDPFLPRPTDQARERALDETRGSGFSGRWRRSTGATIPGNRVAVAGRGVRSIRGGVPSIGSGVVVAWCGFPSVRNGIVVGGRGLAGAWSGIASAGSRAVTATRFLTLTRSVTLTRSSVVTATGIAFRGFGPAGTPLGSPRGWWRVGVRSAARLRAGASGSRCRCPGRHTDGTTGAFVARVRVIAVSGVRYGDGDVRYRS
jgi:hypothetical protein